MVVLGGGVVFYEQGAPAPPLKDLDSDGEAVPEGCLDQESLAIISPHSVSTIWFYKVNSFTELSTLL